MKKIFFILFAFALLLSVQPTTLSAAPNDQGTSIVFQTDQLAPAAMPQETGGVVAEPESTIVQATGIKDFLAKNWLELIGGLFMFFELIVRLTPTEKDNSILNWVINLFNAFNFKKGGGTFVSSK